MTGPIYVTERITTHPGRAAALIEAIRHDYLPLATERGMTLDRILVSPPIHHPEQVNEVTVTWTVTDAKTWWRMAKLGRADTRAAEFWRSQAAQVAHRDRSMAAADIDVEEFCDV